MSERTIASEELAPPRGDSPKGEGGTVSARPVMFTLRDAWDWLSAGTLVGDGRTPIRGITTDNRKVADGDLFVAIRGDRFDANDFAAPARDCGAAAALVDRWAEDLRAPGLLVPDGRRAFGEIAAGWRRRFGLPLIAVTGSNGKTTVKEMIAAVLAQAFGAAHRFATPGNLNNDVGVPISLLRLTAEHRAAVLELGMNHVGEIAWLTRIARPTVAMVNNAQREHQEFLDGTEATAHENGQCLAGLAADGVAVYPGDDPHAPIWRGLAGARRTITFGQDAATCTVSASAEAEPEGFAMRLPGGDVQVTLAIAGRHNVRNALAAAACCTAIGLSPEVIATGLAAFRPVSGRLVRSTLPTGATLIDDSYNANPDSVRAAVDVLAATAGTRVLVLGDMGEVGDNGPQFHREVGAYARERGVDRLLGLGDAARDTVAAFVDAPDTLGRAGAAEHFHHVEPLTARVRELAAGDATVLVKGSRFMKMERVVAGLSGAMQDAH